MERYSEYKDSGVKWLGEIPSHWEVRKSKYLWKETFSISGTGDEELLSVSQYDGVTPAKGESRSESLIGYKRVSENDLVINIMLAWLGGLGVSKYEGIVSPAYCIYKLIDNTDPRFLHYLYKTPLYLAEFARHSTGVVPSRWRMYTDDFGQVLTLLPPIGEQKAIANYLDSVTSKINEAIAQQQKMIDLLNERKQIIINNAVTKGLDPNIKMKPSGVDWIGDIPEHWKIFRIRYNYYLKGRIGWQGLKADEFIDAGPYLVTGTDFVNGKVNWQSCYHITKTRFEEAPEIHVKKGDLLITKDGTVGKTAFIDEIPGPTSLNSHLLIVRPLYDKCNNTFLQYIINSDIFKSYMNIFQTGSIMASISQEKFSDFSFPLPPKQEQDVIIKYLNTKISKVDQTIENITKQISLLQERKQIIINDVVTGKVKVV